MNYEVEIERKIKHRKIIQAKYLIQKKAYNYCLILWPSSRPGLIYGIVKVNNTSGVDIKPLKTTCVVDFCQERCEILKVGSYLVGHR